MKHRGNGGCSMYPSASAETWSPHRGEDRNRFAAGGVDRRLSTFASIESIEALSHDRT